MQLNCGSGGEESIVATNQRVCGEFWQDGNIFSFSRYWMSLLAYCLPLEALVFYRYSLIKLQITALFLRWSFCFFFGGGRELT